MAEAFLGRTSNWPEPSNDDVAGQLIQSIHLIRVLGISPTFESFHIRRATPPTAPRSITGRLVDRRSDIREALSLTPADDLGMLCMRSVSANRGSFLHEVRP